MDKWTEGKAELLQRNDDIEAANLAEVMVYLLYSSEMQNF